MSFSTPFAGAWARGVLAACALLLALPAHGADDARAALPEATLSAEAGAEVVQDQVQITLATEVEGSTQGEVSELLNQHLKAALGQARGHEGIDVHNGAYRLWSTTDRDGHVAQWHGRAEVILESHDFPAASQLAAKLAPAMPVAGLAFSVSDMRRAAEERKLLAHAVMVFRQRAEALARALGFAGYRLKTVTLGDSGAPLAMPSPRLMSAMAAKATPVELEGGRERVTVSLRGTVALLPLQTATGQ